MFNLSDEDKEFVGAILGLWFVIVALLALIQCAPRRPQSAPPKYIEECKVNYIKYPLKECIYKEAE